jgi:hypothetical protein
MIEQTEAQRLADLHERLAHAWSVGSERHALNMETAAELRRLDAIEAEWAALSQDDGKAERWKAAAQAAPVQEPDSECNPYDLCAGCRCKFSTKYEPPAQPANELTCERCNDVLTADTAGVCANCLPATPHHRDSLHIEAAQEIERLRAALQRIARWHGEFPATGKFWDDEKTRPTSYSAEHGSNGERDFMRKVALDALGLTGRVSRQDGRLDPGVGRPVDEAKKGGVR